MVRIPFSCHWLNLYHETGVVLRTEELLFWEEVWCKGLVDEDLTAFKTKIKRLQSFSKTL